MKRRRKSSGIAGSVPCKGTKGLGSAKKCKGGRACPTGYGFRKKIYRGRKRWVCTKIKRRRRR
jgi:hypothetical protein